MIKWTDSQLFFYASQIGSQNSGTIPRKRVGSIQCSICKQLGLTQRCCINANYSVVTQSEYIPLEYSFSTFDSFQEAEKMQSLLSLMADAKVANARSIRKALRQNCVLQTKRAKPKQKPKPRKKAKRKIGSIFCSVCSKSGLSKSCCTNALYHVVTQSKYIQQKYAVTTCGSFEKAQQKARALYVMAEATKTQMRIMLKKRIAQERKQSDRGNSRPEKRKATLRTNVPAQKMQKKQPGNKENQRSHAYMPGPLPPLPPLTVIGGGIAYPSPSPVPPHLPQSHKTGPQSIPPPILHVLPDLTILQTSMTHPTPFFAGHTFQQEIDHLLINNL